MEWLGLASSKLYLALLGFDAPESFVQIWLNKSVIVIKYLS